MWCFTFFCLIKYSINQSINQSINGLHWLLILYYVILPAPPWTPPRPLGGPRTSLWEPLRSCSFIYCSSFSRILAELELEGRDYLKREPEVDLVPFSSHFILLHGSKLPFCVCLPSYNGGVFNRESGTPRGVTNFVWYLQTCVLINHSLAENYYIERL